MKYILLSILICYSLCAIDFQFPQKPLLKNSRNLVKGLLNLDLTLFGNAFKNTTETSFNHEHLKTNYETENFLFNSDNEIVKTYDVVKGLDNILAVSAFKFGLAQGKQVSIGKQELLVKEEITGLDGDITIPLPSRRYKVVWSGLLCAVIKREFVEGGFPFGILCERGYYAMKYDRTVDKVIELDAKDIEFYIPRNTTGRDNYEYVWTAPSDKIKEKRVRELFNEDLPKWKRMLDNEFINFAYGTSLDL